MRRNQGDARSSSSPVAGSTTTFRDRGLSRRFFDAGCWAFDVMVLWLAVTAVLAATTGSFRDLSMPPAAERAANVIVALGAVVLAVRTARARVRVTATSVVIVNPLSTRRIPREQVFRVFVPLRNEKTPWVEGRYLALQVHRASGRWREVRCWAVGAQQQDELTAAIRLPGALAPASHPLQQP